MKEIATHPSGKDWLSFILNFLLFTAIGAALSLMAAEYYALNSSSGQAGPWAVWMALTLGGAVAFWLVRRLKERFYWRLTESELLGGRSGSIRLPLSSVEKIIVGLPPQGPLPGMKQLVDPRVWQAFAISQRLSLLVVFHDGSLLQLKLHRMPNGTALMTELISRLKDRVEESHEYTAEEIRLLRRGDPNTLIRRKLSV